MALIVARGAYGALCACLTTPRDFCRSAVLSLSYLRSRNLVTPMIIHGTWNSVGPFPFTLPHSCAVEPESLHRNPISIKETAQSQSTKLLHYHYHRRHRHHHQSITTAPTTTSILLVLIIISTIPISIASMINVVFLGIGIGSLPTLTH